MVGIHCFVKSASLSFTIIRWYFPFVTNANRTVLCHRIQKVMNNKDENDLLLCKLVFIVAFFSTLLMLLLLFCKATKRAYVCEVWQIVELMHKPLSKSTFLYFIFFLVARKQTVKTWCMWNDDVFFVLSKNITITLPSTWIINQILYTLLLTWLCIKMNINIMSNKEIKIQCHFFFLLLL